MSRKNKRLARPAADVPPRGSSPTSGRWIRRIVVGGLLLGAGTAYFAYWNARARGEFAEAVARFDRSPSEAEVWAEQAILSAGGNYPEAQLLQCRALAATGQWDAALGGFSLIGDFSHCDPEAIVALGESALGARQFELAERALKTASETTGAAADRGKELLAGLDLRSGRPTDALARCERWAMISPDDPVPHAIAADIYRMMYRFIEAIASYETALQHVRKDAARQRLLASLAPLLVQMGNVERAEQVFRDLKSFGEIPPPLRLSHAELLRLQGELDQALAEVDQFTTQMGSTAESLRLRGILALDQGQAAAAVEDLKESVRQNPFDVGAQHKLGQAYRQLGKPDAAEPHLKKSQELTQAIYRIGELEGELQRHPGDAARKDELQRLRKLVGR